MHVVDTSDAPRAIGPCSQAIVANGFLFTSGQIPRTPGGAVVATDFEVLTGQVLSNLAAVIASAGASLRDVVKTTVFVTNLDDFARLNAIYDVTSTRTNPPA